MRDSEWEPSEDELMGRLVDLAVERDNQLQYLHQCRSKEQIAMRVNQLEAIEAEQEMVRRLYNHG